MPLIRAINSNKAGTVIIYGTRFALNWILVMKESTIYVRISDELKKKLKDYCDENAMSMSEAVRYFIKKEIEPVNLGDLPNLIEDADDEIIKEMLEILVRKIKKIHNTGKNK